MYFLWPETKLNLAVLTFLGEEWAFGLFRFNGIFAKPSLIPKNSDISTENLT